MTTPFDAGGTQLTIDTAAPDVGADGNQPAPNPSTPQQTYGDPVQDADLLQLDAPSACKRLREMWLDQRDRWSRHIIECEISARRRAGESNLWAVTKRENLHQWTVWENPSGTRTLTNAFNQPDRLCSRVANYLYADEPEPQPEPATGSDEDRDAAEFAGRLLRDLQSESGTNEIELHRATLDRKASTYRSGYIQYYVSPTGGGRKPITILASSQAQDVQHATVDPNSGMPWPGELTERYVTAQGALTNDLTQAALRWMPKLQAWSLRSDQVRFLPVNANSLWEANAVLIAGYWPYRTLAAWFPDWAADHTPDNITEITDYKAPNTEHLLPKRGHPPRPWRPQPTDPRDRLAYVCWFYATESPDWPDGAWLVSAGERELPVQRTWYLDGPKGREPMDLPLTQLSLMPADENPHGTGLMDLFGTAGETRALILSQVLDMVDRGLNRKTFVPYHSIQNFRDHLLGFGAVVPINPGGIPTWETVPDPPRAAWEMYDRTTSELNDSSALQQIAQGLNAPNIQSGRQALATISQVHAAMSGWNDAVNRAYIRACRIELQQVRQHYTVPQQFRWLGEDGSYKVRAWRGSDLGTTRDVRIKPGTGTLLTPLQKFEQAASMVAGGYLAPEQVQDVVRSNLSAWTGVQDDPFYERIRRQVARWKDGPPPGWQPPGPQLQPVVNPVTGAIVGNPFTGQPQMQPVLGPDGQPLVAPDPVLADIFDQRPVDTLPQVAPVRLREIAKALSGTAFSQKPPAWQRGLLQEFQRMQQALMPPPPPPPAPGKSPSPPAGSSQVLPPLQAAEAGAILGQPVQ